MKREVRTFANIVSDATDALRFLVANGVKVNNTRFDRYFRDARIIEQAWQVDGGSELIEKQGIYPLLTSLSEADALGKIYRSLGEDPGNKTELIRKLKICTKGPLLLSEENLATGSNQARDIYFELVLAATCAGAGLRPILGEEPDIRLRLGDHDLYIECKRVSSPTALKSAARKAIHQLDSGLSGNREGLGIIAFEVSKLSGLSDAYIAKDDAEIERLLHIGRQAVKQHESILFPALAAIKNPRITGVIFYLSTFAFNQASGSWGSSYSLETIRIANNIPPGAEKALRALTTLLGQSR